MEKIEKNKKTQKNFMSLFLMFVMFTILISSVSSYTLIDDEDFEIYIGGSISNPTQEFITANESYGEWYCHPTVGCNRFGGDGKGTQDWGIVYDPVGFNNYLYMETEGGDTNGYRRNVLFWNHDDMFLDNTDLTDDFTYQFDYKIFNWDLSNMSTKQENNYFSYMMDGNPQVQVIGGGQLIDTIVNQFDHSAFRTDYNSAISPTILAEPSCILYDGDWHNIIVQHVGDGTYVNNELVYIDYELCYNDTNVLYKLFTAVDNTFLNTWIENAGNTAIGIDNIRLYTGVEEVLPPAEIINMSCPLENCNFYDDFNYAVYTDVPINVYSGDIHKLTFYNNDFVEMANAVQGITYVNAIMINDDPVYMAQSEFEITFRLNNEDAPNEWGTQIGEGITYTTAIECENDNFINVINYEFNAIDNYYLVKLWDFDDRGQPITLAEYVFLKDNYVTFTHELNKKGNHPNIQLPENYVIRMDESYGYTYAQLNINTDYDYDYDAVVEGDFLNTCQQIKKIWLFRKDIETKETDRVKIDKVSLKGTKTMEDLGFYNYVNITQLQNPITNQDFGTLLTNMVDSIGFASPLSKYLFYLFCLFGSAIIIAGAVKGANFGDSTGKVLVMAIPVVWIVITIIAWLMNILSNTDFAIIIFIYVSIGAYFIIQLVKERH